MTRVGILNCSNMTQDIGCSAFGCLRSVNTRTGSFESYKDDGVELVGLVNCAGCPTMLGPEKLLNRIRTLTEIGVDAIHFSACVVGLCPFKGQYQRLIAEHFPQVRVVLGTHPVPEGQAGRDFVAGIRELVSTRRMTMPEFAKQFGTAPGAGP